MVHVTNYMLYLMRLIPIEIMADGFTALNFLAICGYRPIYMERRNEIDFCKIFVNLRTRTRRDLEFGGCEYKRTQTWMYSDSTRAS